MTPSEVQRAYNLGLETVKFFPASIAGGVPALKALASVFRTVKFMPTGGVSAGNRCLGFRPAFKDTSSGKVYLSCFADGRPAPVHVLDGLPERLMRAQNASNNVMKHMVIAGFVLDDTFYTREEAAQAVACQSVH